MLQLEYKNTNKLSKKQVFGERKMKDNFGRKRRLYKKIELDDKSSKIRKKNVSLQLLFMERRTL